MRWCSELRPVNGPAPRAPSASGNGYFTAGHFLIRGRGGRGGGGDRREFRRSRSCPPLHPPGEQLLTGFSLHCLSLLDREYAFTAVSPASSRGSRVPGTWNTLRGHREGVGGWGWGDGCTQGRSLGLGGARGSFQGELQAQLSLWLNSSCCESSGKVSSNGPGRVGQEVAGRALPGPCGWRSGHRWCSLQLLSTSAGLAGPLGGSLSASPPAPSPATALRSLEPHPHSTGGSLAWAPRKDGGGSGGGGGGGVASPSA